MILSKGIIFRNSFNLPQAFLYLLRMRAVDKLLSYMLITAHKTWLLDDFPKEAKNSRKKLRKVNLCQFSYVLLSRFLFSRFHQESYGNVSSVILDLTLCKLKFFYVQIKRQHDFRCSFIFLYICVCRRKTHTYPNPNPNHNTKTNSNPNPNYNTETNSNPDPNPPSVDCI